MKRVFTVLGAILGVIVLAVAGLYVALRLTGYHPAHPVGAQTVMVADAGHAAIPVTVFYPTTAKPRAVWLGSAFASVAPRGAVAAGVHPLIVMSHGTGGAGLSHIDTALALAEAGYIVAVPTHPGDNFQQSTAVGGPDWMAGRSRQIVRTTDFMLHGWKASAQVDPGRVGLFGFSAGATSVLIAVGGRLDPALAADHCRTAPEFVCQIVKPGAPLRDAAEGEREPAGLIKAVVIAAPGFGFAIAPDGLKAITAPVQLWDGEADDRTPPATNALLVRGLLPAAPDFHLVPKAGHLSFLAPCGLAAVLAPKGLCTDQKGFDRKAFHRDFNAAVLAFYDRTLGIKR